MHIREQPWAPAVAPTAKITVVVLFCLRRPLFFSLFVVVAHVAVDAGGRKVCIHIQNVRRTRNSMLTCRSCVHAFTRVPGCYVIRTRVLYR